MEQAVVFHAIQTIRDLLLEEGRFLSGVGGEVRALETQLEEMKNLLKDADSKRHESESVRGWIRQIRDLAYRAEDAIETYAVKVSSKRGLRKLLSRFSSLHQIGCEISQIKLVLAGVNKSMQEYGIRSIIQGENSSTDDNQKWKRQTFPDFQFEDCFVGKDNELKQIVSLLVDDEQHRVVSVWGMGGIGKTTIARKAYNHLDTKHFFRRFAWVCITQQCRIRSVLEDVLKQLNPQKMRDAIPRLSNTELIEELCKMQKSTRCIIVLDDLWKTEHWDGLKQAFHVQGSRSKILVTTRDKRVAEVGFSVELKVLSMESGWKLLKMKAFPGNNIPDFASDRKFLFEIGKEMVQKCGFLPLTICLLGGVLSKRKSMREWELVNENINAYLYRSDGIANDNDVHAVLNLSYEDLPHYVRSCFLFLGTYQEDEYIYVGELYRRWIALGMISHGNQDDVPLVILAEMYLSELASRSLVQIEVMEEDSKIGAKYIWFKVHDVVRELCFSMGMMENFGMHSLDYQDGKLMHGCLPGVRIRHLAIHFRGENEAQAVRSMSVITSHEDSRKQVRSLRLNNDTATKNEFLHTAIDFRVFKLLRLVLFQRLKFEKENLKGIENLIHLRYLCFDGCEFDELPWSISNLTYLETLNLRFSWNIRVPNVFNKLPRLKHLLFPYYSEDRMEDYALELDEGLDELESLVWLDSAVHKLKSLNKLKNLRTLGAIVRDNESLFEVVDFVNTIRNRLSIFTLQISKGCEFSSTEEGLVILKRVLTCLSLRDLKIQVTIGKLLNRCGNCISSSSIMELYLLDSEIEDDPMGVLGKLDSLITLNLLGKSFVGEKMACPALSFPRLRRLVLDGLPSLREWMVEAGAMPLLSEIKITACPNLLMLPDGLRFISTLQNLTITGMPSLGKRVLASDDDGVREGGEDFDKVYRVPSIIIN